MPQEINSYVLFLQALQRPTHIGPSVLDLLNSIARTPEQIIFDQIRLWGPKPAIVKSLEHLIGVCVVRYTQQNGQGAMFNKRYPGIEQVAVILWIKRRNDVSDLFACFLVGLLKPLMRIPR